MTDYPSISVVIPSYNQGQFIEETILSVLGQQYPNLEILVIDGGSTDNTIEILEQYSDQLAYWHSQKDQGQGDAINQGFRRCSGDIICWLNSDDMYLPGTLIDVGRRLRDRSDQNYCIYGNTVMIDQSGARQESGRMQIARPFDPETLTYLDFIPQPSSFWTRKLWQTVGELDLDYYFVLDWDWFLRASKVAEFEYVPKFYSLYRIHESHKTGSGGNRRCQEVTKIVHRYSSDYWTELYREFERSYTDIQQRSRFLGSLKIPRKYQHHFLSLLFPNLRSKLQASQHLFNAMEMYGI
ncbi:MAG: glycosyltransferase [Leptolyngbya sp. Prado105]|nr:glycosyltransferase [Leptolyngbya sp. Prado105]